MALRVGASTGALSAAIVPTGDAGGRFTVLAWLRADLATRILRLSFDTGFAPRVVPVYGNGSALLPRLITNNDAGTAQPAHTWTTLIGAPDVWTPLVWHIAPDLAQGQMRAALGRPGAVATPSLFTPTSFPTIAAFRRFAVGREQNALFAGDYAQVAIWAAGLGDKEMLALTAGANPLTVRRAALLHYWPLERDGRNLVQGPAPLLPVDSTGPQWVDGPQIDPPPPPSTVYLRRSTAPAAVVGATFRATLAGATAAASATRQAQRVALREAGFRGLVAALGAALPALAIERNRRAPIDDREDLPRLVVRDGGHETAEDDATGEALYTVTATIEAYAKGGDDDALGQQLNELHAAIVAALVGREVTIDLDGRTIWPLEDSLELDDAPASQAEYHIGALYLTMRFDLRWPIGTGPFANI